jgi:hypothetical protein
MPGDNLAEWVRIKKTIVSRLSHTQLTKAKSKECHKFLHNTKPLQVCKMQCTCTDDVPPLHDHQPLPTSTRPNACALCFTGSHPYVHIFLASVNEGMTKTVATPITIICTSCTVSSKNGSHPRRNGHQQCTDMQALRGVQNACTCRKICLTPYDPLDTSCSFSLLTCVWW